MLAVVITSVVLLPIVGLVFYVVHRSRPGRFKLSATVLKFFSFTVEVEANDHRGELPSGDTTADGDPVPRAGRP